MKLTDTQLVLLSAASQRDDRALERPTNLTGGAAGKVIGRLLTEGLIEEVNSRGALPVWRRDQTGARSLRITRKGVEAIGIDDGASRRRPARKPGVPSAKSRKRPARLAPIIQAGESHRAVEPAPRGDDRRDHEGNGLATTLRARLLRRRRTKEAGIDAAVGKGRTRTRLPYSRPWRSAAGQNNPPCGLIMTVPVSELEDEVARVRDLDLSSLRARWRSAFVGRLLADLLRHRSSA